MTIPDDLPVRDLPVDGELWIELHQLQSVIDRLVQAIEQYIDQKREAELARCCGAT